jgi:hypothetical protein
MKFHFELAKTIIEKSFFHPDEILLELLLIVKYFKRKDIKGHQNFNFAHTGPFLFTYFQTYKNQLIFI